MTFLATPSLVERSLVWRNQMVFLNNTLYIGRILSANCVIRRSVKKFLALGCIGAREVPGAFEPIRCTLEFQNITPADIRQLVHHSLGGDITLRLAAFGRHLDSHSKSGTSTTTAVVTRIKGALIDHPLPTIDNCTNGPKTVEMTVNFLEVYDPQSIEYEPLLLIDLVNGIYRPDKDDAKLGITVTL
ncbi:phage major tail tube protein [Aeromonas rivuli]|uniref:phage major tail tube protein n=1 Tax=Aeromonas rivuli TaxID=648794 RepID=UPI0005A77606|nr:phage major tail tube protein [Aeromonas rivuli]